MKEFEEELKTIALREPPKALRDEILKEAASEIASEAVTPAQKRLRQTLMGIASSKWFIILVMGPLLLATVGICAVAIEEHGAHKRWAEVERKLEDAGEILDYRAFFPDPVPDALNFMATPALHSVEETVSKLPPDHPRVLKHARFDALPNLIPPEASDDDSFDLGKWRLGADESTGTEPKLEDLGGNPEAVLLELLGQDAALFDELAAAAKRPYSQPAMPIEERLKDRMAWELSMGHLGICQQLAKLMSLRALAAARLGNRELARESLEIFFKSRDAVTCGGPLINGLVAVTIRAILQHRLPHLLREDCWTEEDLAWLQEQVAQGDGFEEALGMFRCEMAFAAAVYDGILEVPKGERVRFFHIMGQISPSDEGSHFGSVVHYLIPNGFYHRNKATSVEWMNQYYVQPFKERDIDAIRASPDLLQSEIASVRWYSFGSVLAKATTGAFSSISPKMLHTEMRRRMMEAAVALERFKRIEGAFPASLDALVPDYLSAVPGDLVGEPGAPIAYQRENDGYRLSATSIRPDDEKKRYDLLFVR